MTHPKGREDGLLANRSGSYYAMKLATLARAARAKTAHLTEAADRVRAGARSTAGHNRGAGAGRSLARLTVVLGACGLACGAAGEVRAAGAEQFRYHFEPLDPTVPQGFSVFHPVKITENGAIYGTALACVPGSCKEFLAVYRNGVTTVLNKGHAQSANERGTVGGVIYGPPVDTAEVFEGGTVTLIPHLPGEIVARADDIIDNDTAHVYSVGYDVVDYLYHNGTVTRLNIPSDLIWDFAINNRETVAGRMNLPSDDSWQAFRFRPPTGPMELLAPVEQDTYTQGLAINDAGDVLGYSFVPGGVKHVGFWHGRQFHIQYTEGTAAHPTISNHLYWNHNGLIVITDTDDLNSYLVPRTNVRLKLADLTDTLPPWTVITGVNDHGDLIGVGGPAQGQIDESFLLQRVASGSAPSVKAPARRYPAASPALSAARLAALRTTRDSVVSKEKPAKR